MSDDRGKNGFDFERIEKAVSGGLLLATSDFTRLKEVDD